MDGLFGWANKYILLTRIRKYPSGKHFFPFASVWIFISLS